MNELDIPPPDLDLEDLTELPAVTPSTDTGELKLNPQVALLAHAFALRMLGTKPALLEDVTIRDRFLTRALPDLAKRVNGTGDLFIDRDANPLTLRPNADLRSFAAAIEADVQAELGRENVRRILRDMEQAPNLKTKGVVAAPVATSTTAPHITASVSPATLPTSAKESAGIPVSVEALHDLSRRMSASTSETLPGLLAETVRLMGTAAHALVEKKEDGSLAPRLQPAAIAMEVSKAAFKLQKRN